MPNNITIINDTNENASVISSQIAPTVENALKNDTLEYYAKMTEEEKKKKLQKYKQKFAYYMNILVNETSVDLYFQAYEFILKFRQFILGTLGTINYSFVLKASQRGSNGSVFMKTLTLGQLDFLKLMKDENGKVIGLSQSGDNLRFSTAFLRNLRQLIKNIQHQGMNIKVDSGCSSFILTNETLGTRQSFASGKLFKARIDVLQHKYKVQTFYQFELTVTKDISRKTGAEVFKYNITKVNGNPESSSVFSAIGKYFSDEMTAKREAANETFGISVDPSYPNAGNLTELYIAAKHRLNQGKNRFTPRKKVPGMTLFELWNQIRANTEPFYSGGDFLMNQIKSFLGSNPSLTSYSTIRKTIEKFYNALNASSIAETKELLAKELLQENSKSELITKEQKELSQAIAESFTRFFKDLTK